MRVQIHRLNEEFESRWRAIKASNVAPAADSQPHTSLTPACVNPASPLSMQNVSQLYPPAPQSDGRPVSLDPSPPQ
jgi:hypothetical protein